jgi:DNA-binding response OmpR family regulator
MERNPVPTSTQLRPVLTTQGDRYTVAAIVVQENPDGGDTAELTELASRLADEARRLLLEERPGSNVTAAVAVAAPEPAEAEPAEAGSPTFRSGEIEIDRHAYRAGVSGRVLTLSFREFELLAFLVEHPGQVFSRRQLVSSVWDGAAVGARTVDVHVRRLRVKLGAAADRITTVRNVGYRLEPAVTRDLEAIA